MAISLDALPKEKPEGNDGALHPEGQHKFKIEKAEVKVSNSGNEYLNIMLKNDQGVVWDRIMYTDSPYIQYKFQRFLTALNVQLQGELEFKDLAVLALGRELLADIVHKTDTYKGEERTKAEVDIFSGDVFYAVGEGTSAANAAPPTSGTY